MTVQNNEDGYGLTGLIEALTILKQYGDPKWPTHCEHDVLTIIGIRPAEVSDEDKAHLERLGFGVYNTDWGDTAFQSFRFGSA